MLLKSVWSVVAASAGSTLALTSAVHAATIAVPAGGNLQAAINAARPGDTILLTAGATYTGNFKLPAHGGTQVITIRTADAGVPLPLPGVRVTPADAPRLAKIASPNAMTSLTIPVGSSYWRLELLEFPATVGGLSDIIKVGLGTEPVALRQPHHITFDRLYIHGDPSVGQKNGIVAHASDFVLRNSYISDIKQAGAETHAFISYNGAGPYLLENNYLEASGINVMFGGADPVNASMVPSDITLRRNHVAKNPLWMTPRWDGKFWTVKNLFELKVGRNVHVEGNLFEYNWSGAGDQPGYAILMRSENQYGGCDWCETGNVTFQNNIVRKTPGAINLAGLDFPKGGVARGVRLHDVTIRNNLFEDIDVAKWRVSTAKSSAKFAIVNGSERVTFDHNTMIMGSQTAAMYFTGIHDSQDFVYTNNLSEHKNYGMKGDATGIGTASLLAFTVNPIVTANVLAGGRASLYPAGNYFPPVADWSTTFVDFEAGDYRLSHASPYRSGGTDGKDLGADFDELEAAFVAPPASDTGPAEQTPPRQANIVLYASQVTRLVGDYALLADPTAAGGVRLHNPNRGAAKVYAASAQPASYAEFTFDAEAGRPYQVWFRGKAEKNLWSNDSMFVQFSGVAGMTIGTTGAMSFTLEEDVNAGLAGWGWQDDGFGSGVLGMPVVFETSGRQVIRIQPREDGLSIDQIVISSQQYLTSAPGAPKNDATIVGQ